MSEPAVRLSSAQLTPLRRSPLKEQVTHELLRLMDEGRLKPGDRIPTERELAEQLEVSRSTVREAVQFLQALGVLEIRHGSGTFIARPARSRELRKEWRRWTRRHASRIRDLLEVRQGIESFAAELAAAAVAAGTAPAAALDAMASALGQMERAGTTRDVPKLVRADMLFHHAVCDATGNDALVEFAEVLGEQLVQERAASWDLDGRVDRSLVEHRAIYDAIAVGDPNAARVALLDHLRSVGQDIDQSLLSGDAETKERGATA